MDALVSGSQVPMAPRLSRTRQTLLIGLMRLHALQSSSFSQIKAIICLFLSKSRVDVSSVSCCVTEVRSVKFCVDSYTQRCVSRQASSENDKRL